MIMRSQLNPSQLNREIGWQKHHIQTIHMYNNDRRFVNNAAECTDVVWFCDAVASDRNRSVDSIQLRVIPLFIACGVSSLSPHMTPARARSK